MAHNEIVYLLHFERSYRHVRHYIGFTQNLERRREEHRAGRGSALVAAAIADGIEFQLAAIGRGSTHREHFVEAETAVSAAGGQWCCSAASFQAWWASRVA